MICRYFGGFYAGRDLQTFLQLECDLCNTIMFCNLSDTTRDRCCPASWNVRAIVASKNFYLSLEHDSHSQF